MDDFATQITAIANAPLRVQVADMLRRAIINGKLRPGTVLVETVLAEQMKVSRAPVREAIQILESDGLVETVAYKGKRVKPLTAREIEETFSLRSAYEVLAAQRALDSGASVEMLWTPCKNMKTAAASNDFEALIEADEDFHRTLIQLADHDLLLASWNNLYLRVHQIMALRNDTAENLAGVAANHPPIVKAMEAGDRELATQLIHDHAWTLARFDPQEIAGNLT